MGTLRIISRSHESFEDRRQAGHALAEALADYRGRGVAVVGIPRGGMIVARVLAEALEADLDLVLARKLGAPGNPELAIGSISEDGRVFLRDEIAALTGAADEYIRLEQARATQEIARRAALYRKLLPRVSLAGRTAILTDDGVATGSTMEAAVWAVRRENAARVIVALPVGPEDTLRRLAESADEVICLRCPPYFEAVGQFYQWFEQVDDREMLEMLELYVRGKGR